MHKAITGAVLTALLTMPAVAAAQTATGFRGGIRNAGLATGQSTSTINEPVFGGYLGFGISDRLALQLEAVYGARGGTGLGLGTDALDDTATPVTVAMHYVEVPILLRTGFPGERFLASFFAGPYTGFLLSCEVTPDGGSTTTCDDDAATQRFTPQTTDFGLVVGAGLDIAIGESTIFLDARYTLGILSIQSGGDAFDARHNGMGITGGFAVPLGR